MFKILSVAKHGPMVSVSNVPMGFSLIINKSVDKLTLIAVNSINRLQSVKTAIKATLSLMVNVTKISQIQQPTQDVVSLVPTTRANNAQKDGTWIKMENVKKLMTTAELGAIKVSVSPVTMGMI